MSIELAVLLTLIFTAGLMSLSIWLMRKGQQEHAEGEAEVGKAVS